MNLAAAQTVHVQTDWVALATFIFLLVAGIGGLSRWVISRIDRYSNALIDRFDKQDRKLADIQGHLGEQDVKIARIEGRMGGPGRR